MDKHIYKLRSLLCAVAVFVPFFAVNVSADTLIFKDGKEEKGLIVKEFSDRIMFSTVDGEREVLLSTIRSVIYDDEERRLLQLGKNEIKREEYVNAYRTFEEVVKLDPENTEASERMKHLRNYLENATYSKVENDITSENEYFEGKIPEEPRELVRERIGITLEEEGKYIYVAETDKVGEKHGFKKGDRIISVWGENAVFSNIGEVARLLMSSHKVHIDIERRIPIQLEDKNLLFRWLGGYNVIIGATLKSERLGLVVRKVLPDGVFAKGGVQKGDIVTGMDDVSFEYLPFKEVASLILRNRGKHVEMVIQRKLQFWEKGRQT